MSLGAYLIYVVPWNTLNGDVNILFTQITNTDPISLRGSSFELHGNQIRPEAINTDISNSTCVKEFLRDRLQVACVFQPYLFSTDNSAKFTRTDIIPAVFTSILEIVLDPIMSLMLIKALCLSMPDVFSMESPVMTQRCWCSSWRVFWRSRQLVAVYAWHQAPL